MRTSNRFAARAAFTLVELLVVISIIALLVSIALPSFGRVRLQMQSTASAARLNELDNGAVMFSQDHQGLYPGQDAGVVQQLADNTFTGSQVLAVALFGLDSNFEPITDQQNPARQYAPFNLNQDIATVKDASNADRPGTIVDRFNKTLPILYYPSRPGKTGKDVYNVGDNAEYDITNSRGSGTTGAGDGTKFEDIIQDEKFGATPYRPYRPDGFLLFGAGVNGTYFDGDDNVNFNR